MKFYGNGAVWDAGRSCVLCKFMDGEIETEEPRVIGQLTTLGYKYDDVPSITTMNVESGFVVADASPILPELTKPQIKGQLDALKIPYTNRDNRDKLLALLGGAI